MAVYDLVLNVRNPGSEGEGSTFSIDGRTNLSINVKACVVALESSLSHHPAGMESAPGEILITGCVCASQVAETALTESQKEVAELRSSQAGNELAPDMDAKYAELQQVCASRLIT